MPVPPPNSASRPLNGVGGRILDRAESASSTEARLATRPEEIRAAQRLRFEVFNLELKEGLAESFATGLDADPFDSVCDHLIVEEPRTGLVVGTYRLQTGRQAAQNLGYYSAQEFDLAPLETHRGQILELGRACVAQSHRNLVVLGRLWKGIAAYAREQRCRYLIGCSSLTGQDPAAGAAAYAHLQRRFLIEPQLRVQPRPACACPMDLLADPPPPIPRLLMAYLSVGARICGPPAIDREFKTIDFLTMLDIERLPPDLFDRYLRP
ncbi:MAG TPA: GNAT family N-acyltransferase [Candidatus Paceibacterota bacterium]|nr:GNAT family N-acyltransferase [Verrucomicrobiota bacterium]HRZ46215.1 GNAT family N-acyltransferase [Candidatus Paceibacterota bacterium]HRZ92232.1 GNAT family N-acyltransferase [Candidatus Paceibacterota bacterium]